MKLEVFFTAEEIASEYDLREKSVAVVDVLRSSSTIITAIHNGARQVIPVATVSDAMRLSKDLFDDSTMLCGERQGKLIDGFDIDNSPANYRPETVKDKSILFTSSNGSETILRTKHAKEVVIAGFVNIGAVITALANCEAVVVVCAGNGHHLSLEDALCAGMIVSNLTKPGDVLADGAYWAKMIYERCADSLLSAIRGSSHGKYLEAEGFGADVTFCATCDVYTDVPRFDGNVIRATRGPRSPVRL